MLIFKVPLESCFILLLTSYVNHICIPLNKRGQCVCMCAEGFISFYSNISPKSEREQLAKDHPVIMVAKWVSEPSF